MPNKVRQLRGTDAQWAANDVVIDDGEIALALSPAGTYRMKIGNGVNKFSELAMFGGEVKYPNSWEPVNVKHATDIRLGETEYLELVFDDIREPDFYAVVTFESPLMLTTMCYPQDLIKFTGASVNYGEFVPEEFTHYTMVFWDDGAAIQCHVRGYHYA